MDDILQLIDKIKASHTNDDGNLDEFGTLALTFVGIVLAQRICKELLILQKDVNVNSSFERENFE